MLSSVNNNQPSFQGMYVIKGSAKGVDKASEMIYERCGSESKKLLDRIDAQFFGKKQPDYVEGFENINTLYLAPVYGKNQPQVHKLFATNEHVPNICNWYMTMLPHEKDPVAEKMKAVKIHKTPYGTFVEGDIRGIINGLKGKIQKIVEEIAPYREAEDAAKRGDMDKMSDFLIEYMKKIKQRMQEVRELATVPYEEPKVLNAKEVIAAIRDGRFDFVTGEIK